MNDETEGKKWEKKTRLLEGEKKTKYKNQVRKYTKFIQVNLLNPWFRFWDQNNFKKYSMKKSQKNKLSQLRLTYQTYDLSHDIVILHRKK